ncbi:MAG: fibronectin type III domain-containing protein [Faecalibacterium sp.]|nr:fibronectin type III domain-containing protein [Ruminococcus sp.]MCM1391429.1 fibronectin type III domain-containing protein [Ruminococcus sp.]MCM1485103.1 fibronectin type III domain-containing protein [Faecalibacterium sp.]
MKKFITSMLAFLMAFVIMFTPMSVSVVEVNAASAKTTAAASKPAKPAKVSSVSASATTNSITIKWGKVKNATGYRVYQKKGNEWKSVKTVDSKTTSLTVKSLKSSTEYQFKVRAYTKKGSATAWGDYSKVVKCKTKAVTKVTISSTSATNNSVTLKWGKITGATGYRVYQKKGDKWVKLADVTSCSYTVKKLKASTSYSFQVKAFKTANKKTTWYEGSKTATVKTKSDKAIVIDKYNTAINNAKKVKNCTVTDVYSGNMTNVKTSSKLVNSILGDSMNESMPAVKTTYKFKNGKDARGVSINSIIPPESTASKLTTSDVSSATIKSTKTGSTITLKFANETMTYDGKTIKGGKIYQKVLGGDPMDDLFDISDSDMKIKSIKMNVTDTVVTATLNTKNQLTKWTVKTTSHIEASMVMEKVIPLKFSMDMNMTDTLTIKY